MDALRMPCCRLVPRCVPVWFVVSRVVSSVVSRCVPWCVPLCHGLSLSPSLSLSLLLCSGVAVGLLWLSPFPIPNLSWFSPFAYYSGGLPPCHYDFAQVVKFYIA